MHRIQPAVKEMHIAMQTKNERFNQSEFRVW
ncbi:hypothetical protein ES332_D04G236900v1 [Gossypium tomentosum]|uniref:Uncharacterized protein n=1 Tax=Gossypium tomentosum TaxID=34277 RepID=A0A5D2LJ48_GOSTO|nr:hypothetical protein ES332_D04G236900v1 [Gossypium tomentosum]